MKTIFYNFLVLFFFLIFIFLILSFFNYKYSGNPVYDKFGIEIKHLKYFKNKDYNNIEKEYLNYFSKYTTEKYLEIYRKENKRDNLISSEGGVDVNLVYFVDINSCRENQPEDYVDTDIVLLGDSYLWGVSINKPFDISGRLRSYMPDKKILNLGTPGSGPVEQLKILKHITQNKSFKNFIWFFYEGNDYQESTINEDNNLRRSCSFKGQEINQNFKLINTFNEKYGFYVRLKIFLAEFLRGLNSFIKLTKDYENHYKLNDHDYDLTLYKTKKYLDSKKVNKRIIYYIPSYSYHSHKKNSNHPQIKRIVKLKKKIKEISLKNNFEFIDGNIFLDKIDERLHFYHYGYPTHFNSLGYKLISEQIYENFKKK